MLTRQREGDRPAISCKLDHGPPGWLELQIFIDNRTSIAWVAVSLEVLRPRASIAVWQWDVMQQDDYGGFNLSSEKLAAASGNTAALKLEVQPEGTLAGSHTGRLRGDRNNGKVYIRPAEGSAREVDMVLTVQSLDPSAKHERYRIKRQVPLRTQ